MPGMPGSFTDLSVHESVGKSAVNNYVSPGSLDITAINSSGLLCN